jgi:hypothetical protein
MSASYHSGDVEKDAAGANYAHLINDSVQNFSWNNVTVTVKDRATRQPLNILSGINGFVEAGELLALMGPRYVSSTDFSRQDFRLMFRSVAPARQHFSMSLRTVLQYQSQQCSKTCTSMEVLPRSTVSGN